MKPPAAVIGGIRRLHRKGWGIPSIASAYRLPPPVVASLLAPPAPKPARVARPPKPTRAIKGSLARLVRLHHIAGESPAAIAAALRLDAPRVERFLAAPPPPRPRPRREPAPPRHWSGWAGVARPSAPPSCPAGPSIAGPIAAATGIGFNAGPWERPVVRRGGALDAEGLARLRALRAEGRTHEELAATLGISVATVKRALGPGYRPRR